MMGTSCLSLSGFVPLNFLECSYPSHTTPNLTHLILAGLVSSRLILHSLQVRHPLFVSAFLARESFIVVFSKAEEKDVNEGVRVSIACPLETGY
jgi:hypothetical protein